MIPTPQERLRAFHLRNREYLRLEHDRLAAARFVVDTAGELRGPALDIGTGKGLLAIELARRGLEVVSIDVDDQERGLARLLAEQNGLASKITFESGDAARLRYADEQFGCVAMMDVLHHLNEPSPVLREMVRVVAARGIVLIADFDEFGFEIVSRVHRAEGREHPRTTATVSASMDELAALGFHCTARRNGHQHDIAVFRKDGDR
jgi:2-polyprenyl-3-methyl-5-hydroxy-6-metoxy-1,4-benzoquinol methylase